MINRPCKAATNQGAELAFGSFQNMLKELEEFAFRGCPRLEKNKMLSDELLHNQILDEQRSTQRELIEQLKNQLEDLESYAYQVDTATTAFGQIVRF